MGCLSLPGWYCDSDEIPPFTVTLSRYSIGKYEVRNDEFSLFVKAGGYSDSTIWSEAGWRYIKAENRSRPVDWIDGDEPWINSPLSNTPDKPVNNISWYEAEAYCRWLSRVSGEHYSLPTEAQWERAARGPDPGRIFPWGNEHDTIRYNNLMYSSDLLPVGSYPSGDSYEGCSDLVGNVEEFCSDWYALSVYSTYQQTEPVRDPTGPDSSMTGQRAIRGTITIFYPDPAIEYQITTFRRMACMPGEYYPIYGFRVAKNFD